MKKLFLLISLLILTFFLFANKNPHGKERAIKAAMVQYSRSKGIDLSNRAQPNPKIKFEKKQNDTTTYYAIGFENRPGLVFISAGGEDDPVIGMTETSEFDTLSMPPGLRSLLRSHEKSALSRLRTKDLQQKSASLFPENNMMGEQGGSGNYNEVNSYSFYDTIGPLLTTKWGQSAPYNWLCPRLDKGFYTCKTIAGCGPVAMAQVMRYNEYPAEYNWGNMPNSINSNNWDIANLILDCGDYADANHGCSYTETYPWDIDNALRQLGYSEAKYVDDIDDNCRHEEYIRKIRDQIRDGFPVIVDGYEEWNIADWHLFVLDGYTGQEFEELAYFHINWGWQGNYDGWYRLNSSNPPGDPGPYNYNQGVTHLIKPPGLVALNIPETESTVRSYYEFPIAWQAFGRAAELDSAMITLDIVDYRQKSNISNDLNTVVYKVANLPGNNLLWAKLKTPLILNNDSTSVYYSITAFGNQNNAYKQKYHSEKRKFYLKSGEFASFTTPNNGTLCQANMKTRISWQYNMYVLPEIQPTFTLSYTKVSGPVSSSMSGTIVVDAQGSFIDWMIPPNLEGVYKLEGLYEGDGHFRFYSEPFTITSRPVFNIMVPVSNTSWLPGSQMNIRWTTNLSENVRIKLYRHDDWDIGDTLVVTESTPNDGEFIWDIPESIKPGALYGIELRCVTNTHIYTGTAYFAIKNKITIENPVGTVTWEKGKEYLIKWKDNFAENVNIKMYGAEAFYSDIVLDTPSDGAYSWTIPSDFPSNSVYNIRISKVGDETVFGKTNYFNIIEPLYINIEKPEPNTNWQKGQNYFIKWNANTGAYFKLELIDFSQSPPAVHLIDQYTGQGYYGYEWTVPGDLIAHNQYKIRVSEAPNCMVSGLSEFFSITNSPTITATVPNSRTSWQTATTQTIQYSDNLNGNVSIYLHKRSQTPTLVETIAQNVPSTGTYSWGIPQYLTPGNDYFIKMVSQEYGFQRNSDDFELTQGNFIYLTLPDKRSAWEIGDNQTVTWVHNFPKITYLTIQVKKYSMGINQLIHEESTLLNNREYSWTIPSDLPPGSNYYLTISVINNALAWDNSDQFIIKNGSNSYVSLLQPDSTASWKIGTRQKIFWDKNFFEAVNLAVRKGGVDVLNYNNLTADSLEFLLPGTLVPGNDYTIQVSRADSAEINDISQTFEILPADFIRYIQSPTGYRGGDTATIVWEDNIPENVKIELIHADTVYHLITPSAESNGSFLWAVPGNFPIDRSFIIKITSIEDSNLSGSSGGLWVNFPYFMKFTTPVAGQVCLSDSTYEVRWEHNYTTTTYGKLELYKGDSVVWVMSHPLFSNGFGYWDWTVNILYQDFPPGNDYRIKVSHLDRPDLFVFSDPFSLINCHLIDFSIGADTTVFVNDNITLIPTDGFESYEWLPYHVSDQIVYLPPEVGENEIICNATYVEGCEKSDTIIITGLPQPCRADASFSVNQHNSNNLCATYTFAYANSSWYNYQLIWDFGDGTVVEAQSLEIEHTFPGPGNYQVTCRHFDPDYPDCKDSVSANIIVASAPIVEFRQSISVDTLTLIASIEGSGEYQIEWLLDGTPIEEDYNKTLQNNDTLMVVFPANEVYRIEAQLIDTLGGCRYNGFNTEIRITDIPPCRSTTGSFAFRPLEGYGSGNRSDFRFRGEVNSSLECYNVSWNMGDGAEELTDTLDFTYNFKPGTYYVTMKLNNCGECEFSYTDTVVAGERLDPGLPRLIQACDQTQLDAMEGDIGYFWSDSTTNRSLLVTETGEYWVMLVDKQGFYSSDTSLVTIFNSPVATLDSLPLLCSSDMQYLLSEGKPVGGIYIGTYISGNAFDISEAGAGFHQVVYYFEDEHGCSDSVSSILEVEAAAPGRRLVQNQILSGGVYFTGDSIIAGGQVDLTNPFGPVWVQTGADAYFKAGTVILLKPGTHIQEGSRFRGVILPLSCVEIPEKNIFLVDASSKMESGIIAVPNPTSGMVKFICQADKLEQYHVEVYNSRGQLIISRKNQVITQTILDLSDYPEGIYYARLSNSKTKTGIKLLKR